MILPARETHISAAASRLDEFAPVYAAIRAVGPDEIALFHTLTWIRRFGRRGPDSIINAPNRQPILDTAIRTGFLLPAEDPGREIVVGAVMGPAGPEWARSKRSPEAFKALHTRYAAKIAMNFRVEPAGAGECRILTETRVYATSPPAARAFAVYWRIIYPGSALIRRMWLRAIQRRAEAESKSVTL